ncbi:MAG: cache domain-containing protein, partial [Candidatus Omnitrophica bacterium]|nr:cache domain-containing protein [Candidatus Omnitrophota bacterium]
MERRQKKKINDYKRITLRYFVTLFLPVWLLGCFILWLFFYSESQKSRKSLEVSIAHTLDLQKESIILDFVSIVSDLNFLSRTVELSGFCERFDPLIKEKLDRGMVVFLKAKGFYDRIAIINASGKEIMSTDYREGTAYITPDDHLRDRSKEYYFQKTFQIEPNEIYISPFELKIEHGGIQEPHEPMVRLGTPLSNRKGEKEGVLVVNYFGKDLIHGLSKIASDQIGDFMFLNRNGYWMMGRTSDEEWGFMFEGKQDRTFRHAFPEEWRRIAQEEKGQFTTPNGFFSFETVFPFKGIQLSIDSKSDRSLFSNLLAEDSYYWKLVAHIPTTVLEDL